MFFEDHEKSIYTAPQCKSNDEAPRRTYDPLAVDRILIIASENRLNEYISYRNAPFDGQGDIGKETQNQNKIDSAKAELELARIARVAFQLGEFPEVTDGEALEILYDFLDYMKKKGNRDAL